MAVTPTLHEPAHERVDDPRESPSRGPCSAASVPWSCRVLVVAVVCSFVASWDCLLCVLDMRALLSFRIIEHDRRIENQEQCSQFGHDDASHWADARPSHRPRQGARGDHRRDHERGAPATRGRRRGRAVAALDRPRARDGVVGDLPLRRQSRRPAHAIDHRGLRLTRRRRRSRRSPAAPASPTTNVGSIAGTAVRGWALARPHEYMLLYGTPVPGYAAPDDTVAPGTRVTLALLSIVRDARDGGRLAQPAHVLATPPELAGDLDRLASIVELDVPASTFVAVLAAWTQLFGLRELRTVEPDPRRRRGSRCAVRRSTPARLGARRSIGLTDRSTAT